MFWKGKTNRPGWSVLTDDPYNRQECFFTTNQAIPMGEIGEIHMDPFIETRIKELEQKLFEMSKAITGLKQDMLYPHFETLSVRKTYNTSYGVECERCKCSVMVVERGNKTLVACPSCHRCSEMATGYFRNKLDTNGRVEIPTS